MDVRLAIVVVNRVCTRTSVVLTNRSTKPGFLRFPQNFNALPNELLPSPRRCFLDSGSALSPAWLWPKQAGRTRHQWQSVADRTRSCSAPAGHASSARTAFSSAVPGSDCEMVTLPSSSPGYASSPPSAGSAGWDEHVSRLCVHGAGTGYSAGPGVGQPQRSLETFKTDL